MNSGLEAYQAQKREDRLREIDEAIQTMREAGVKITKASLAEEMGISVYTMQKPYIKAHLLLFPEFNRNLPLPPKDQTLTINELEKKLAISENKLARKASKLKETEAALIKLKQDYKELDIKYRRLLGAYQQEAGEKIIKF